MEKLQFKFAELEGPLDLILHLIAKHKLDIHALSISSLLEQYLAYIATLRSHNLEVASEFLEMASRLIYIKTLSLLPRPEEEQQAKARLLGELMEYQACKQAALALRGMADGSVVFIRPPLPLELDKTYRGSHALWELVAAYADAAGKGQRRLPPPRETFTPLVAKPVVSVNARILHILRRLYKGSRVTLDGLFTGQQQRSQLVATFLAVLELIKGKRVTLGEDNATLIFHRE